MRGPGPHPPGPQGEGILPNRAAYPAIPCGIGRAQRRKGPPCHWQVGNCRIVGFVGSEADIIPNCRQTTHAHAVMIDFLVAWTRRDLLASFAAAAGPISPAANRRHQDHHRPASEPAFGCGKPCRSGTFTFSQENRRILMRVDGSPPYRCPVTCRALHSTRSGTPVLSLV